MNPYQEVIDWLRSEEGSAWSEMRMHAAAVAAAWEGGSWHLNAYTGDTLNSPLYLAGVLSVKEDAPA